MKHIKTFNSVVILATLAGAGSATPKIAPKVQSFPLTGVRLLDGPFQHAQKLDRDYLLALDPDRLLHNFRTNAGLAAKAPIYGGWESAGVAGHTFGHYLSAMSMMYQSTGDARLKQKIDYCVDEIALCQEKSGDGYVSAIPDGRAMFNDVKAGHGDGVHRGWVPWYTMHKLFAGLRDAYQLAGNPKAKTCLIKLSDWAIGVTRNLSDEQWAIMLTQEHGGMNETLADVYAITGEQKYLDLAHKFSQRALLDPMSERKDILDGWHANTQIPKVIGFERIYELTGDPRYGGAAHFFWETVIQNRTFAIGGNSDHEHFFDPADTKDHLSGETAENCNVYNMLKLTRDFYEVDPSEAWMEYYERALFNQILSSQDPVKGGFNYLNSLKPGGFKVYSNPTTAFWCCVGTGMENHAKYGDTIYFHDDSTLFVNLFIASRVRWAAKGLTLTQNTRFPDADTTELKVAAAKPTAFTLKLREPAWTTGASLSVNGKPQKLTHGPGGYTSIARTWKNGDVVTWRMPMHLQSEPLHDSPRQRAILYGPIVLAGDMGREGMDRISDYVDDQTIDSNFPAPAAPAMVSNIDWNTSTAWTKNIHRAPGSSLAFEARGIGQNTSGQETRIKLIPFSRAQHIRYNVYWDIETPSDWQAKRDALDVEERRQRDLAARTLDEFRPNEQQSETDHGLAGEKTEAGNALGRKYRHATDGGYFEFHLKTDPTVDNELVVTYWGSESGNRVFDLLVDGQTIASQILLDNKPNEFFDKSYAIPSALTHGKRTVTVRFAAHPGAMAGGIFGVRMVKASADR
ncbi:glycosyl hydrolase [Capsulimonas corticalis]|uniref:Glycosyl hydrolase n=1 Tax=Capsulimonas corticalis TaxID=2219043 RepID=A0A402D6D1_9BACT|nr:glycoside hydrolase family 127 protein [Capsulimonas corticalis]BDI32019.1 glycosyl hydrolase [Capsulimonas corticalis]